MECVAAKSYSSLKKLLSTSTVFLYGTLLLTFPAYSAPFVLDDSYMDQLSAGNASEQEGRGVIIGNSSESISNSKMGLYLSDEAQQGARGLNLVNSTESAVANTVNIWDGNTVTLTLEGSDIKPVLEVNQLNQVTQQQVHAATLSGYSKPDSELTEVLNRSGSDSSASEIVTTHNVTNLFEENRLVFSGSSASINTRTAFNIGDTFDFEGHLGQGIAAAGSTEIHFDGGSADIALIVGGGISVEADTADATGAIDFLKGLGDTGVAAGIDVEGSISLFVEMEFPEMDIEFTGVGCGVVMGSCNASSESSDISFTKTNNSTLDILENHQYGQSSFLEESTLISHSSFELENVKAAYIVVDDSSLELYSDITLELSESAQKETEAMNIVNAIGSNVANSTNISRALQFNSLGTRLILNQFNVVHHGH